MKPSAQSKKISRAAALSSDPRTTLDRSELERTLGFNLRRAWTHMEQVFNKNLSAAGVTPQLYATLIVIGANPGCTISALCRAVGVSQTNIVPAIDTLMQRGWVHRDFASHDRRAKRLSLTHVGEAKLQELRALHQPVTDYFTAKLGAKNMRTLVDLLALMGEDPS